MLEQLLSKEKLQTFSLLESSFLQLHLELHLSTLLTTLICISDTSNLNLEVATFSNFIQILGSNFELGLSVMILRSLYFRCCVRTQVNAYKLLKV